MVDYPPPESILKPLKHEYTFLCGPGPTNVAPRVCYASSLQVYSIFPPLTISLLNEIQEGLRYVFQTKNSLTYAVCASGMAGMETAILNLVERGDKFMSLLIGYWGPMAADIGERCGKTSFPQLCTLFDVHQVPRLSVWKANLVSLSRWNKLKRFFNFLRLSYNIIRGCVQCPHSSCFFSCISIS